MNSPTPETFRERITSPDGVQIELLTRSHDARHDLTARLAKVLLRLDEGTTMKRVLVDDPALPELALRVDGVVYEISADASEAELLELLDDLRS